MAWSEEEKAEGRKELLRRSVHNTPATDRKSFFIVASWCLACLLMMALMTQQLVSVSGWTSRFFYTCLLCGIFAGFVVTAALSYVRYLDWRRHFPAKRTGSL